MKCLFNFLLPAASASFPLPIRVQEVIKRPLPDPLPPYARKTAVSVVGSVMKSAEVLESRDTNHTGRVVKDKVEEHEKHLQVLKRRKLRERRDGRHDVKLRWPCGCAAIPPQESGGIGMGCHAQERPSEGTRLMTPLSGRAHYLAIRKSARRTLSASCRTLRS